MIELKEEERQGQCASLQHHFVGADEGVRKRCTQTLSEKEVGKVPRRQAKRRKPGVLCTIQHVNAGAFDLTKAEMTCLSADKWDRRYIHTHASLYPLYIHAALPFSPLARVCVICHKHCQIAC